MNLLITYSKTKKHEIKLKDGKTKEVPNDYLWLVLDSGVRVLIKPVHDEDKRLLKSHAKVER